MAYIERPRDATQTGKATGLAEAAQTAHRLAPLQAAESEIGVKIRTTEAVSEARRKDGHEHSNSRRNQIIAQTAVVLAIIFANVANITTGAAGIMSASHSTAVKVGVAQSAQVTQAVAAQQKALTTTAPQAQIVTTVPPSNQKSSNTIGGGGGLVKTGTQTTGTDVPIYIALGSVTGLSFIALGTLRYRMRNKNKRS